MFRSRSFAAIFAILAASTAARAVTYDFIPVVPITVDLSQFNSAHGNGYIPAVHAFDSGGRGPQDNLNAFATGGFTPLFPSASSVPGHLVQTNYGHSSTVTFDLTGYTGALNTLAFGIWNTSDEVVAPVGGPPVYQISLVNSAGVTTAPTTFNLLGNVDNSAQLGRHHLVMNPATGEITFGGPAVSGGVHTDAAFWDNIPAGTKKIIVTANLPALSSADGVGYYFAEVVPEPTSLAALGASTLMLGRRRR